jgi:thiamine-phosphate pyrophosphorylase
MPVVDPLPRPGLYAIVDPDHTAGRDPLRVARAILEGGCALLQLRAKRLGDGAFVALARAMAEACREAGVPFVVNDRADVARLAGAQGLHLGQDDLPVTAARGLLGEETLIGVSTHDRAQARQAHGLPVDLIGFGPVFATRTKDDPDPVVGLETLAAVARGASVPVVAIGGITLDTARAAAGAGARWVASIAAVCGAEDPRAAAQAMDAEASGEQAGP